MTEQNKKPSVNIGLQKEYLEDKIFSNLCFGLEEEGIPYNFFEGEEDVFQLAFDAAQQSRLSVGIGLGDGDQVIIQHKKLEADQPFFRKKIDENFQAKIMGSNAARLVKGIPIKEIPDEDEYYSEYVFDDKKTDSVTKNDRADEAEDRAVKENNINSKSAADELNNNSNPAQKNSKLDSASAGENIELDSESVEKITKLVLDALKNIEN